MKRRIVTTLLVFAAAILICVGLGELSGFDFWDAGEPLPTVDGPEDPQLADRLEGWVIWAEDDARDIRWLELPGHTEGRIELHHDASVFLGVDDERHLLYVEEKGEVDLLRRAPLDGGPPHTILEFEIPVRNARMDADGRWLLYEAGRSLCFRSLTSTGDVSPQQATPATDWNWDAFFWLKPGESIAYQALGRFQSPSEIRVLHLRSGDERTIMVGHHDLEAVDPTPEHLLTTLGDPLDGDLRLLRYDDSWSLIEKDVDVPGLLFSILGVSPDGLVVYEGLPTTGVEQKLLGWGLTWPRAKWTVKVADPRTGAFQTLIPHFDSRYGFPDPIAVFRPVQEKQD